MCPLSNLALHVVDRLEDHNLERLMDRGVMVTINSDDPADALGLTRLELVQLARNSLEASFASDAERESWIADLDAGQTPA